MATDAFDRAAHLYQEVTIEEPEGVLAGLAHYELAQIYYLRRRNVAAARRSLEKVLQLPGAIVGRDAKLMLARLFAQDLSEPATAIALYESLLRGDLDEATRRETLMSLADCYYRMGEFDASSDAYRRALVLPYHPDTDHAYMRLSNLAWLSGGTSESIRLVRELSGLTSDREHRRAAVVSEVERLMALARFTEAERRLEDAADLFPSTIELPSLRSRIEVMRDDHRELDLEDGLLRKQQKKIRWGSGRRRRASSGR